MNNSIANDLIHAPAWINDLILYEVATKGYTSPNGPESGTFDSLREKLPYLYDLGITGIWLTGHSLSDPKHFYNIWTQYACILPDELDPTLGDAASFKNLIDTAHSLGIKIVLDVITHGVMSDSPLVTQHPEWFKGGSWGMTDYDWQGNHPDLDDWWVDLWVKYVKEFGIDGFRLDVATYRPDLWSRIRQRSAALGHPIVVLAELGPSYTGAIDFIQWGQRISVNHGFVHEHGMLKDVAGFVKKEVQPVLEHLHLELHYTDGTVASNTGKGDVIGLEPIAERDVPRTGPDGRGPYITRELLLGVKNAPVGKQLDYALVSHPSNPWPWKSTLKDHVAVDYTITVGGEAPTLQLALPFMFPSEGAYFSVQLSCHDNGWDGFPLDQNAYAAQGSRFVFGYTVLLAPGVPIFMGGEEFNADYVPLPTHTPGLFGEGEPGTGRWLYASWLQWDQLNDPERQAMLEDVKRLIQIRKTQSNLIRPAPMGQPCHHLHALAYTSNVDVPIPYLYQGEDKCILVAGNPDTDQDVEITFHLPAQLELTDTQRLSVNDLWHDTSAIMKVAEFHQHVFTIRRDKTRRGGLLILLISKL
jgi:Alpha amylase, catalytic domain